jgi:membrane protein DedA with SNARE-associated domain
LLEKKFGKDTLESLRNRFEKLEFFVVAFPALLPPGTPYKPILLAAGVFGMHIVPFLLAVFVGRLARFTILSVLILKFGPQIVTVLQAAFLRHKGIIAAFTILVIFAVAYYFVRGRGKSNRQTVKG